MEISHRRTHTSWQSQDRLVREVGSVGQSWWRSDRVSQGTLCDSVSSFTSPRWDLCASSRCRIDHWGQVVVTHPKTSSSSCISWEKLNSSGLIDRRYGRATVQPGPLRRPSRRPLSCQSPLLFLGSLGISWTRMHYRPSLACSILPGRVELDCQSRLRAGMQVRIGR